MLVYLQQIIKIIIIYLVLFIPSSAFSQQNTGKLSVNLKADGYIYLNSELIATDSFQNLNLMPGEYKLAVYSSSSQTWTERGYEQVVIINPGEKIELTINNSEFIYINSLPYNSKIYVNEKSIATTPAFVKRRDLDHSEYVKLKRDGYNDQRVFISKDESSYFVNLKPKENNIPIQVAKANLGNSQTSWLKEGLILTSLLSSWGAFYFKREADKNYNKYLTTANPAAMTKYYDRTTTFDTYSEISIAISAVAVTTYMYFLIFD